MSDALRDALKLCRGTLWELLVEHGRGEARFGRHAAPRRHSERAAADALELPDDAATGE